MVPWPHAASTIALADARIEVETFGPPPSATPTLVFLHEGLGSVAMWRDFPRDLGERTGLGVLSYSRRGYGGSSSAPLPRDVRYMHDEAAALPALLAECGVARPILVGHSDGASIALLYAGASPPASPAPLGLVLEAPHVFVENLTHDSIADAAAKRESIVPRLQRYHRLPAAEVFGGWSDVWLDPRFQSWNIEAALPQVTVPTLVVQGAEDAYGTWAQVDAIAAGARGRFESARLESCGHSPHRDQKERTLDVMTRFVATLGFDLRST